MRPILVFLAIGMLLFSLAPIVAEDEATTTDSTITTEPTSPEEPTTDSTITTEPTSPEEPTTDSTTSTKQLTDLEQEYQDVEIIEGGTAPGDFFYGVDKFFDGFKDPLEVREERVGEIKDLIENNNIDGAREALEEYNKHTVELEKEADPGKREEARRSAAAIYKTMREVEDKIPENERGNFFEGIVEKEASIITAVEISSKIKELCIQLAELDPTQYKETCRSESDAPNWKKELDAKLTDEQRDEAKKFGQIMSQCMKTSGRECKCEDISFYDFSIACSRVAPLAIKCDDGSEEACKMIDEVEMPELPDYLQDVFDNIESEFGEAKYDMHMPRECIDEKITNPRDCRIFMIKENAPPECRQALLDADVKNEKEGREVCDRIMFEQYAPQECIDKGITNPKDCGKFMKQYGPKPGFGPKEFGPAPGKDCMQIKEPMERLKCFEGSMGQVQNQYGVGERFEQGRPQVTWQCKENRIHDLADCKTFMEQEWPQQEQQRQVEFNDKMEQRNDWRAMEKSCASSCLNNQFTFVEGRCICGKPGQYMDNQQGFYEESECKDGCSQECPGASRTNCVDGGRRCECSYEEKKNEYGGPYPQPPQGYQQPPQQPTQEYQPGTAPGTTPGTYQPPQPGPGTTYEPGPNAPQPTPTPGTENPPPTSSSGGSEPASSSGGETSSGSESSSGGESSSSGESSSGGESAPATGGVISNKFLDYYFE